jgi:hypothetical protein
MLSQLNKIVNNSKFIYIFPLFIIVFIFLTNSPDLKYVFSNELNKYGWDTILYKSNNLFSNIKHVEPESHSAKTVFRLTIPLIVKTLNLSFRGLVYLQFFLYYIFLLLLLKYFKKEFSSSLLSYILVLGISTTYFGKALITDFRWFDGWAFLFFLISIYTKNYFILIPSIYLGLFTDERFIFCLPILYILNSDNFDFFKFKFSSFFSYKSTVVVMVFFLYLLSRFILQSYFKMEMPTDAIGSAFKDNVHKRLIGIGIFTFFQGYWLIVIYFVWYYLINKHNLLSFTFVIMLFLGILSVFLVYDVTRSGAYLMSFVFLFLKCLHNKMNYESYKQLILLSSIVSIIYPATFVLNGVGTNNSILNDYIYILVNRLEIYIK